MIIYDTQAKQLKKSKDFIDNLLDKEVKKGSLKIEDKGKIQHNFSLTEDLNTFQKADFIVEVNIFNLNFYFIYNLFGYLKIK